MNNYIPIILAAVVATASSYADSVTTKDGSQLNGTIITIESNSLSIKTNYAGILKIPMSKVATFSTKEKINLSLDNGSTYVGAISGSDEGGLSVSTNEGQIQTYISEVEESWQTGTTSPSAKRLESTLGRNWAYQASFDLAGKSGNSDSNHLGGNFRATLTGQRDTLEFFAGLNYQETDDSVSADDVRAGVSFTSNISDSWDWYARSEFGKDVVKDIDLFTNAAGGVGYVISDTERRKFNLRAGLGYRYEAYDDATAREDLSAASLDLGYFHQESYNWGVLTNRLTFTPTIEDFGNFRFVHDTSLDLPLKTEGWSIRMGINFDYDSEADASNKKELDTTYYTRLVLDWK